MVSIFPHDSCYLGCDGKVYDKNDPYRTGYWGVNPSKPNVRVWIFDDEHNFFFEEDEEELQYLEGLVSQQCKY